MRGWRVDCGASLQVSRVGLSGGDCLLRCREGEDKWLHRWRCAEEVQRWRCAEVALCRGVEVQRCRGTDLQISRISGAGAGAEMQRCSDTEERCRGAGRCRGADAEMLVQKCRCRGGL